MSDNRKCPVEGCADGKRPADLMCRRHWYKVPKHLRDTVYHFYRNGPISEYLKVREAAIESVPPEVRAST